MYVSGWVATGAAGRDSPQSGLPVLRSKACTDHVPPSFAWPAATTAFAAMTMAEQLRMDSARHLGGTWG